ncbi:MAG TPA: response regulator transcription factor [Acidimicrobiales bacterium]|nr:response regulator transcription factor [Acidimicrobiales bacterium]
MTPERPVRVLLADDHPVYRLGLRALLQSLGGFEVVGEATDGAEAVTVALETRPDVVVMDLQMPGMSGIEATRRITERRPDIAVLVLTYSDEDQSVLDAVLAGARGYVLKEAGTDNILRAIQDVASGEMILGPSVARKVQKLLTSGPPEVPRPFPELTDRELEILVLMAQGLNNSAIALRIGVGDKRVRNCISDIYGKLQVPDRAAAIIKAREAGVVDTTADGA